MTVTRAEVVRREVAGCGTAGMGLLADYSTTVVDLVRRAVPFDSACVASTDPASGLLTGTTKIDLPDARDAEFAPLEYEIEDVNLYADIAQRMAPVGVLQLDTDGRPEVSARWRDFLVPHFGMGHELRAAFRDEREVWGLLGLYRATSDSGFSPAEAEFLAGLSSVVARGLRTAMVTSSGHRADGASPDGPAVMVIDPAGEVVSVTPRARHHLDELGWAHSGELPVFLHSLVASARAVSTGRRLAVPRVRLRTPGGGWSVFHAAPLARADAPPHDVVVTIEPARMPDVVPLVMAAYGLSGREQQVVALVLAGESTTAIGKRLYLSPYTIQDHLKSVFDKAGVRSRRELVARVFFDHYAPRMDSPLAPSGWFAAAGESGGVGDGSVARGRGRATVAP